MSVCLAAWTLVAWAALHVGSTSGFRVPTEPLLRSLRIERVLQASVVGAALAGAGVAFQAVLRNALADPYLLGITSGAALGSYLWRLPLIATAMAGLHPALAGVSQQSCAFVGGLLAAIAVLGVAGWRGRLEPTVLVLVGVILSTIVGSILLLLQILVKSQPGFGSFQGLLIGELVTLLPWQLPVGAIVCGLCAIELMRRAGRLNLTSLSDDEARTLGLRLHRERFIVMGVASLLTATAVALSGPIGFVGLICPHLARLIVGSDNRRLLPASMVAGAALLTAADALSRYLSATNRLNDTLPVGIITSLLGGPFFLLLLLRRRTAA
ncbi:MAG: iron ABC transporter permease [Tepidisphaeraceae bacterium]